MNLNLFCVIFFLPKKVHFQLKQLSTPVLHCISSFEGTLYKTLQDIVKPVLFISCCFRSTLTSGISFFTTFQNLIQNHLKNFFATNLPFLTDSPKHPTP